MLKRISRRLAKTIKDDGCGYVKISSGSNGESLIVIELPGKVFYAIDPRNQIAVDEPCILEAN